MEQNPDPLPWEIEVSSLTEEEEDFNSLVKTAKLISSKVPKEGFSYWIETQYISPNPLQSRRFFPKNGKIFIHSSPAQTKLMKNLKPKKGETIKVRGPAGVGKSLAIVHWVLCSRRSPSIRVFYINNPENLISAWYLTVVRELLYTMAQDVDKWEEDKDQSVITRLEGKTMQESLVEHCTNLEANRDAAGIIQLFTKYHRYCASKKISLIGILDQYKLYERSCNRNSFLFENTNAIFNVCDVKIYGNSDISSEATSSSNPEIFLTEKFTTHQAISYLWQKIPPSIKLNLPTKEPTNEEEWKEYPEFMKIYETTEFLPYEMEKLVQEAIQKPNSTFKEIFEEFHSKRYLEITEIHNNWIKNYTFADSVTVSTQPRYKLMYMMSMGFRNPTELAGFLVAPDPNLFYSDFTLKPPCVKFTSRIVENALFRLYSRDDNFWEAINSRLYSEINALQMMMNYLTQQSGFKGNLFERYFECTMKVASLRHSFLKDTSDNNATYNLSFQDKAGKKGVIDLKKIKRFVPFNESELLSLLTKSLKKSEVEVLVPNSPDFEYVDFILVDSRKEPIIYLIQSTINIYGHDKVDVTFDEEYKRLLEASKDEKLKEDAFQKAKPISLAIYEILKANKEVKKEFIWVGLAYRYTEKKWLTVEEVFEFQGGKSIDVESKVALVNDNGDLFKGINFSLI